MRKRKKKGEFLKGVDRKILILSVVCLILFLCLVVVLVWSFSLKGEVRRLNDNINTLSLNAVNDFSLFVMSKVDRCEAVTLMAEDKSITINNVECR